MGSVSWAATEFVQNCTRGSIRSTYLLLTGLHYVVSVVALGSFVFRIVDGTGVFVVWWSVVLVFRIVDGTGMFEGRKPWGVLCCQC